MADYRMKIVDGGETQKLEFVPPTGADFDVVSIPIPFLILDGDAENAFRLDVRDSLRRSCGLGDHACQGDVALSSSQGIDPHTLTQDPRINLELMVTTPHQGRVIQGALISCSTEFCPLNEPPSAGDRSPLEPYSPPSLYAEADTPTFL